MKFFIDTANIAQISGGTAHNIVPDQVIITGEYRSRNSDTIVALEKSFHSICSDFTVSNQWPVTCHTKREYDSFSLPATHWGINRLRSAAQTLGLAPEVLGSGGGSDANFFNARGIPSVVISSGMRDVHTYNEHIYIQDLYDAASLLAEFLLQQTP